MKTTNYELSKELSQIGFSKLTDFYHVADADCSSKGEDPGDYNLEYLGEGSGNLYKSKTCFCIPAYDLDTLIEALPNSLFKYNRRYELEINFVRQELGYFYYFNQYSYFEIDRLESIFFKEESLADTAARLLIILHEKGFVKFGGENDGTLTRSQPPFGYVFLIDEDENNIEQNDKENENN